MTALLIVTVVLLILAVFWGSAEHDGRRQAESELFWTKSELSVLEAERDVLQKWAA